MNKKKIFYPVLWLGVALAMIIPATVWADGFSVNLQATDNFVPSPYTLTLGIRSDATNGLDSTTLGEIEQPELPPTFDARFVSISSGLGADQLLTGTLVNYHHMARVTQSDRWKIQFQSDDSGDAVTFTWPAGLGLVGGGGWVMLDQNGTTLLCDMTQQTTYTYHTFSAAPQIIYVKHYDGYKMRSFIADSIALSPDVKGKYGVAVKRKAYMTRWCVTLKNESGLPATGVFVEYALPLTVAVPFASEHSNSLGLTQSSADAAPKQKKWTYDGGTINPNETITLQGVGTGVGKTGKLVKSFKWLTGEPKPVVFKTGVVECGLQLLLYGPTVWNIISEMYTEGFFTDQYGGKPAGVTAGKLTAAGQLAGKDYFKLVYHPKYGDLFKTLYKSKQGTHKQLGGTARCISTFDKDSKDIIKAQKSLPPDKHKNILLAELLALKCNIASATPPGGKVARTPAGFGELVYTSFGSPFDGMTVSQIAGHINTFVGCDSATTPVGTTAWECYSAALAINSAFSGPFDTASYGVRTVATGVKAVGEVGILYRPTAELPPSTIDAPAYREPQEMPITYELSQNYPNPFNPTTEISFTLAKDARVSLKVYNTIGQLVATVLDGEEMTEGDNTVDFDGTGLSSGVYFYRLSVDGGVAFSQVKKMMLLK